MDVTKPRRGPVPKEALDYFRRKKIKPGFKNAKAYKEEHDHAFTVAGILAEDYLGALFAAIDKAIEHGLPFSAFRQELRGTLSTLGFAPADELPAHRLRLVFDTNLRVARAAGQWARIQRTRRVLPFLLYELGPSQRHRPEHVAWAGTIRPASDPWWRTHFPPNGHRCRCRVRQLSRREAAARGGVTEVPAGAPDPGFDRNPGASRLPAEDDEG